jgi:hypothetical protein
MTSVNANEAKSAEKRKFRHIFQKSSFNYIKDIPSEDNTIRSNSDI